MTEKVDAVSVKLPEFWADNVETWFSQVEAQFRLRGITQDETMYTHIVAVLHGDAATRAERLINKPPSENKYKAIKNFLMNSYGLPEAERADRLLRMEELGSRKPSQLMSKILHLYGDNQHNFLVKHIFLRALPERLQHALASCKEEDLNELAKEADRLAPLVDRQAFLTNSASIDAVRHQQMTGRYQPRQQHGLCYFHAKFGSKARSCRHPCSWVQGNARTSSQ